MSRGNPYLRRSTKDQKGSLEDQKKAILDDVKRHPTKRFEIVEWYVDHGISGDETEKRFAFLQMHADAIAGKCSVIL